MDIAFQAGMIKQKEGELISVKKTKLYKKSFELEKRAAMLLLESTDCEPTRSILFRSAAWLAIKSGDKIAAIMMAEEGLKYTIHNVIKNELTEVLNIAKAL